MVVEAGNGEAVQREVLRKVNDGFQLLASLYETLGDAAPEARVHVTNATRELAAIQRMYERRGNGRG